MPTLLFVESNTTGTGMLALRQARALGMEPVLLTNRPDRYHGLPETGATVVVCDTNRWDELRHAALGAIRPPIAGITTTSEFYLPAAARLAVESGLPGNPPEAVAACRDKAATRDLLRSAGLPQPLCTLVRSERDVASAVRFAGLPCVVKPVDGTGSEHVSVCGTVVEARDRVAAILAVATNVRGQATAGAALVEAYLPGPEVSVEMFSHAGHHHCVGVTEKQVGAPPSTVEQRHLFPAGLQSARATAVVETVVRALDTVGIRTGPSHTEVRLGGDRGDIAIVEINARLAGGMIPQLVRLVDGVDLLDQQLRVSCGLPPLLAARRRGVAGIQFVTTDSEGTLDRVVGVAAAQRVVGVTEATITAVAGSRVGPARSAYDRLGYVIAAGPSRAAVADSLDTAVVLLRPVVHPVPVTPWAPPAGRSPR